MIDQILSHLRSAWYYRWQVAATAWVVALGGWTAVWLTPDRYEARARVFVDTQSMLRPLLSGLAVQPNMDQVVSMMSRTLISRVNVEKVVQMAGLDSGRSSQDEQLIARLTQDLTIRSAGRENLYTISYSDQDRERAKQVVQSLLTIFVERSVGDKRRDSDSARQFIEEQLRGYSEKLTAAENAVTEFKRKHQGLMPGEGRDFFAALSDAKVALRRATLELKEAVNARDAIKQQIATEAESRSAGQAQDTMAGTQAPTELDHRILALEQKLDGLRLTYTEQHPDIVALSRMQQQLREQKAAEEKEKRPAMGEVPRPVTRTTQGQPSLHDQLMLSLATAEATVAAMRARVAEHEARYRELQAAANALPQIDAEYKQLTRDYEVIRARYDKLLERREQAQISGEVEASDAGMGFRIIDPPLVPLAPSAPNRALLMTLVLFAALGCGFGYAFLMGQVKTTFSDERGLREASGIRVLGSVAMTLNDKQRKRRARGLFALALSYVSLLSAYGAIMASLVLSTART